MQKADEDYPETIEVSLEHNRTDMEYDDVAALKYMIFDIILTMDGRKPLLSAEWENLKDEFSRAQPKFV